MEEGEILEEKYQDDHGELAPCFNGLEEGELGEGGENDIDPGNGDASPKPLENLVETDHEMMDECETNEVGDEKELSKIVAEYSATPSVTVDPNLCHQCKKMPHKYRCPKCNCRTCSLDCSKQHKDEKNCDGLQRPFDPVLKLSEFSENISMGDQKFIHSIKEVVATNQEAVQKVESQAPKEETTTPDGRRYHASNAQERYLSQNAYQRRIWLNFTDDKGGLDNSRHEQHSDTIFWTVDITFRKQLADGFTDYTYRVHQVPETIRAITVLRQFLKPRPFGPLVSKADLDLEKLAPFIEKGVEHLNVFMTIPYPEYNSKFYPVLTDSPFIDSTRNRLIVNHPQWLVVLDDEFLEMTPLTSEEMESLSEKLRQERLLSNQGQTGRGAFRGNRSRGRSGGRRGGSDNHRGNWRGRGGWNRDGSSQHGPAWNFEQRSPESRYGYDGWAEKRRGDFQYGGGRDFKRGRYENRRGGLNANRNFGRRSPSFDPFEPFEGDGAVPVDSLSK